MEQHKESIGVFDSGYGGLTILKEIVRKLPEYNYVYLGDNARAPYGARSFEVVYEYTREAVHKLFGMGCRLVILACNTASAKALRTIQQVDLPQWDPEKRVLGVIRPSVEALNTYSQNGHVGILATRGTVASGSYPIEVGKLYGEERFRITQLACPMWVPLVENNELDGEGAIYFVRKYIQELLVTDPEIDTIILGCTHYPLLRSTIRKIMGEDVCLVNPAYETALELRRLLDEKGLSSEGTEKNEFPYRFYVSDLADEFKAFANSILPYDVEMTKKIDIEKY